MKDDKDGAQLSGQWHRVCSWRRCRSRPGAAPGWRGRCWHCFASGSMSMPWTGGPLAGVADAGAWPGGDAGGEPVVASPLYKQRYARWTVAVWTIRP